MTALQLNSTRMLLSTMFVALMASASAADWSDTSISWRYGTDYREPYVQGDISKNIFSFTHASGFSYGTNFLNIDLLLSNSSDPAYPNARTGAQEIYLVYRNTLDFGKITGRSLAFGPFQSVGLVSGFDANTKDDAGYNSKKRMLVLGPTLIVDVPGFWNIGVQELWESNAPFSDYSQSGVPRYEYKTHSMLSSAWGIPLGGGDASFSFEGFFNYIAAKGSNEFGGPTSPETDFDAEIMMDIGRMLGSNKHQFRVGLEYQYWKNKFGNPSNVPGSKASTPMIRADYHF